MQITITSHGTITLITPEDPDAASWLENHLDPDATRLGECWACEPRYVPEIALGFFNIGGGITVDGKTMVGIERL